MSLLNKPKSEITPEELQKREEEEFNTGPHSVLMQSVKNNTQVLIHCHNKKVMGHMKAFDRHCDMVLENVKEMWTEVPKSRKGKKSKPVNKDHYISKMFLVETWSLWSCRTHSSLANRASSPLSEHTPCPAKTRPL
ncbi:putative small nuclear ribonucleoprotein Sm D2 [Tupaia chinensis]|uniref:Small nuclear ribonucleoprotein Sm D2 n=1 Tax=Tupaia chinensis TaxID=246437 RepID=L9KIE3_TUPCH|nr:putative small nuclear ribonucleoprotein Sm D2 [Tupaia chinensis]